MCGTQGLLDHFHTARPDRRFRSAALVGAGRDNSHRSFELVDCVSERVVLIAPRAGSPGKAL